MILQTILTAALAASLPSVLPPICHVQVPADYLNTFESRTCSSVKGFDANDNFKHDVLVTSKGTVTALITV